MTSVTPHMHVRGKDMTYTAVYPGGTSEVLLTVPSYDFNWQITYELAEPKRLPKATRVHEGREMGRPDVGRDDDRVLSFFERRSCGGVRARATRPQLVRPGRRPGHVPPERAGCGYTRM
jgi:hypothetical protein